MERLLRTPQAYAGVLPEQTEKPIVTSFVWRDN